ncbi:rhodanese-like domain-containing protein [Aquimarina sp. ERC-38]|uniref:rhodanese-like domain-containing protein n=1 Tax=Aquimarina sp. ERC-38 TaxID=2949996 RepID=UPI0022470050|nr:rhodanese-like domain-containing protein [Aquimarina sp. ERC-38]UZO79285.1 rhodanese-like domain-containing protein [Aquimarina sp. ERC-38]
MKIKLLSIISILLVLSVSCAQTTETTEKSTIELLSPEEMNTLLSLENVQLIDVRTPKEFQGGHIKGAINIDYRDANFLEMLAKVDKSKPVAVYCKKGGRSGACSNIMQKEGFQKIYDLDGGITSWIYEGKPVSK